MRRNLQTRHMWKLIRETEKEHAAMQTWILQNTQTLHQLNKEKNKYIADTDPKTYGSNEAQREAALAVKFPQIEDAKQNIKIAKLGLESSEFRMRCLELLKEYQ